ncbi:DUF5685 family protein [Streptomyces collinus]|uniref:DUF5685 family protein n=1 Tax=Streptomyces collinus TaxID=42684 RepID=UPI0009971CFC|nr:DUF5685 family protein [Streptomyces collinus]UJA07276.1 expression regulator [Streptomyces collinus]UJA17859.1 expression regulator [Streptomyces collinus]
MFGIVRPCGHRLGEGLKAQWTAHLCGLCLALRRDHGQFARIVTNYDGLLISVLTEAQAGLAGGSRRTAGPCALRGMRTASVAQGEGARLAAAVSLVLASAKVRDHVADRDGLLARKPVAAAALRVAAGWGRAGERGGSAVGFDTGVLLDAVDRQTGIEALAGVGTPLLTVTEPTETATAAAFAHTAVLAGRPGNAGPLAEAGRLFGRLAHLLDAVEDREADARSGAWNPLTATGTSLTEARRLAEDALHGIRLALREAEFADGRLAHLLLVHELRRSVDRAFGTLPACAAHGPAPQGSAARGSAAHGTAARGPAPHGPESGADPYVPFGPGGPHLPHKPKVPRALLPGCGAFLLLCCTCRMCCAEEYEGPWSRKKREGCCRDCDCDGCSGCGGCDGCAGCGDCCDGCDCCDCCCPCDSC